MNRLKYPIVFSLLIFLLIGKSTPSHAQSSWDWHIAGGQIVDGTGAPAYRADILIRADSVGYIGPVDADTIQAARTADASGKIVTPGFIDAHAHGDPLRTPEFRNFLAMGVTTILLGQDGTSPDDESLQGWFEEVEKVRPAVNIAALSGHATIRNRAGAGRRPARGSVLMHMEELLEADLQSGAFGLSSGLEYVPGIYADETELVRLAAVAGRYDAIVMSHMRSEDDSRIEASLDELVAQGMETKVHASHLKVVYGEGAERAGEVLRYIEAYRDKGIRFSADTYPYIASYTGIGIVFPEWAKTEAGWQQVLKERPDKLERYLLKKVEQRNGPGAILFGSGEYIGKTLEEISSEKDQTFAEILMEMGPQAASAAHFVMDRKLQDRIINDPDVMISSDGSPSMRHPRGYGSFARIIDDYVVGARALSIEMAVFKMSGLTAETVGFEKRGKLKKGNKADILMFEPDEIRDRATYERPHRLAYGFDWIWVNGKIVRENGEFKEVQYGQVLRKGSK